MDSSNDNNPIIPPSESTGDTTTTSNGSDLNTSQGNVTDGNPTTSDPQAEPEIPNGTDGQSNS